MKRAGFTMIELIFVIVILGILSAVALPKFIGVSEQAHVGKLKAFVGTLNRTVAPALWSKSISEDNNGSIALNAYQADLNSQIAPPSEIDGNMTITNCQAVAPAVVVPANQTFASGSISGKTYTIGCVDGNESSAPQFWLSDGNKTLIQ